MSRHLLVGCLVAVLCPAAWAQTPDGGALVDSGVPDAAPDAAAVVEKAAQDAGAVARLTEIFRAAPPPDAPLVAVTYHEDTAFQVAAPHGARQAAARARTASQFLTTAIEAEAPAHPDSPDAEVVIKDGTGLIRVRGHPVTTVYELDAEANGFPSLEAYARSLETRLGEFVPAQRRRGSLQRTALHFFFSIFIGLITVVVLNRLRSAFDRADELLSQRRESINALTILRVPVMSGEAVGGVLAFLLDIGRVLGLLLTVGAAAAAVLGQFDRTRPMLGRLVDAGASAVVQGLQAIGSAVPNVLLAALIIVGLHAGLRVLHVLLEGVSNKRVVWTRLPPPRVPVFKAFVTWSVILVGAPLVAAAAFGRFGTPLEHIALAAGAVGLLGCVPAVVNWVAGGVMLWRQTLSEGDWIEINGVKGEVSIIRLTDVTLVPEGGGSVAIPHVYMLFRPVHRMPGPPAQHVQVTLEHSDPPRELLDRVRGIVRTVDADAQVNLVELGPGWARIDIHAPSLKPSVREQLWLALADAAARGELKIAGAKA